MGDASASARPVRVCYVLDTLAPAGTTDLVHHLVARLDRRRFAPEVVALRAEWPGVPVPEDREAEAHGRARFWELDVPAHTLRLDARQGMWRRLRPFVGRLRERAVDVVHAHSRPADLWAVWGGVAAATPVRIYSRQATYGGMPLANRARYAVTARAASRVVAVSEAVRDHLRQREGVPRERIELIHDGIDLDAVGRAAPAARTRAALGIPADAPLVGCVAAFTARKNVAALVAAAPRIWARVPAARFLLVGDGPERAAVERAVAASGRPAAFHLAGWRADVVDLLAAVDVVVLPSLWEGLNLSLLTACALGRAVVATNLRANREIVEPGVSGLLPTPERTVLDAQRLDEAALGDAVGELLAEPERRRRLGEAARTRTLARFGAHAMAARHEDLYARLLHDASRL